MQWQHRQSTQLIENQAHDTSVAGGGAVGLRHLHSGTDEFAQEGRYRHCLGRTRQPWGSVVRHEQATHVYFSDTAYFVSHASELPDAAGRRDDPTASLRLHNHHAAHRIQKLVLDMRVWLDPRTMRIVEGLPDHMRGTTLAPSAAEMRFLRPRRIRAGW